MQRKNISHKIVTRNAKELQRKLTSQDVRSLT